MKATTRITLPLLAASSLIWATVRSQGSGQAREFDELVLVPQVLEGVRELLPLDGHVTIYHFGEEGRRVHLERLRVEVDGLELVRTELDRELAAGRGYGELNSLIERLPHELSHRASEVRHFAPEGLPDFTLSEGVQLLPEIQRRVFELQELSQDATRWPVLEPAFRLYLDQLFPAQAAPGSEVSVTLFVDYTRPDGSTASARTSWSLSYLGPFPALPPTYLAAHAGASSVAGDLHVHSCHGEALGACAPSGNCTAESLQTSGSFSYAELRSQYEALGLNWFTATDHSYCINSSSEYQTIRDEVDAITDGSFVSLPDIEVSSDEQGAQVGSDLGNTLCLGTTEANHMGAHGIQARISGGSDGLLGFCDGLFSDVLDSFSDNVAAVRAQGGLPIINHPAADSFGWNSFSATQGIEAGQLQGVEIWNGASQSGQGGNVGAWIDWLLAGRLLYAYSGSDTHDAAFAFGANHLLLDGQPFDRAGVLASLAAGRVTISNGPALVIEAALGGALLEMGSVTPLPTPTPSAPIELRAHYDFGAGSGTIRLYRGRVGDAAESLLCQSPSLFGSGVYTCADTLQSTSRSWYRAYAEGGGGTAAYTNPIFLEPGSATIFGFCPAKQNSGGCTPQMQWSGTPSASAGQGFVLSADEVNAGQNGILVYSASTQFTPFQGGTLCLAPPIVRTPILNSGPGGVCGGQFQFDFNDWIVNGHDGSLSAGSTRYAQYWYRDPGSASFPTGLTSALQFLIGN